VNAHRKEMVSHDPHHESTLAEWYRRGGVRADVACHLCLMGGTMSSWDRSRVQLIENRGEPVQLLLSWHPLSADLASQVTRPHAEALRNRLNATAFQSSACLVPLWRSVPGLQLHQARDDQGPLPCFRSVLPLAVPAHLPALARRDGPAQLVQRCIRSASPPASPASRVTATAPCSPCSSASRRLLSFRM
jgi:hypothetical protein